MAKFPLDYAELLALDHQGYSVFGMSTTDKIVVKRESFPEGEVPPHLQPYLGQNAKVAQACKGRKGKAWVQCLRDKAKEMGITKRK